MLAIKNQIEIYGLILLISAGLLTGCAPPGPRALLEGRRLVEKGKYPQAIEKLKLATALLRTNAQAWNYLGLACHYAGQSAEAEKAYRQALALDHDLIETHYNLGCLWLAQSKLEGAQAELTTYTLRRGNSAQGFLRLGTAQLRSASIARASGARTVARPRGQGPDSELVAAEKSFNEALRLGGLQDPEAWNGLGLVKLERNRAAEAADCFNRALKQQPDYRPARLNLAIVSQQYLKDRQLALRTYREYLALKPVPDNAEAVKAAVRQLEQELSAPPRAVPTNAAAHTVTNAAAPKPDPTNASASQAQLAKEMALNARAVSNAAMPGSAGVPAGARSNTVPPVQPSPARYVYRLPAKPVPGNRDEAGRSFAQGLKAQQEHRLPAAVQAYRLAAQADPSFYEAYFNLGLVEAEAADLPAALAAYEQALAARPESVDAHYNFALVLRQANYLTDAVNELEKLLATHPNEPRAHLALGNLYAQQLHQPAQARQHYLKLLEADPQNPQATPIRYWLAANPP